MNLSSKAVATGFGEFSKADSEPLASSEGKIVLGWAEKEPTKSLAGVLMLIFSLTTYYSRGSHAQRDSNNRAIALWRGVRPSPLRSISTTPIRG